MGTSKNILKNPNKIKMEIKKNFQTHKKNSNKIRKKYRKSFKNT